MSSVDNCLQVPPGPPVPTIKVNEVNGTRSKSVAGLGAPDMREKLPTNISRARSPNSRPRASSLDPGTLYTCSECRYLTTNKARYDQHFRQPRHINQYRDRAYKEPKKRQVWLKVWFSQLEAAELENYEAFELTEENEQENDVIDEDIVFRLPTADEIADASRAVDRKVSSTSSTCSTSSYQSSSYEG